MNGKQLGGVGEAATTGPQKEDFSKMSVTDIIKHQSLAHRS